MRYVTYEELEKRMGSDVLAGLSDGDADVVSMAVEASEAFVDVFLSRRYAVPLALDQNEDVAPIIRMVVLDLAEYRLHSRRSPVPEEVRLKQDESLHLLVRLGNGEVDLPGFQSRGISAKTFGARRVLTNDELHSF